MSFTLWRGVCGLIKPTRRPGTLEELIRMLPEGIGIVPLLLNFKAGTEDEFRKSIPDFEQFVRELSEQKVDMTIISGTPPFMLLGYDAEARLIDEWSHRYAMPIVTDSQMQAAGLHAMGIKKFIGASYSPLQNQISINYMKQAGLTAVAMEPIDVPFDQVAQISVEQLYAHVKKLFLTHKGADGIYIQGGGWQIHRLLHVRGAKPGYGRLLAELP
jgi:maleate isomerase